MAHFIPVQNADGSFGVAFLSGLGVAEVRKQFGPYAEIGEALRTVRSLNYMEGNANGADMYRACPACAGAPVSKPGARMLAECSECGAKFGRLDDESFARWNAKVLRMNGGTADRYFDVTKASDPMRRLHGWINAAGEVVQIG